MTTSTRTDPDGWNATELAHWCITSGGWWPMTTLYAATALATYCRERDLVVELIQSTDDGLTRVVGRGR